MILTEPAVFKGLKDKFQFSYYVSMMSQDFSNLYFISDVYLDRSNNSEHYKYFYDYVFEEDISRIFYTLILEGHVDFELHQVDDGSKFRIFLINNYLSFQGIKSKFFVVRDFENKIKVYKTSLKNTRKITVESYISSEKKLKKIIKKLHKLDQRENISYGKWIKETDVAEYHFLKDFYALKLTKEINWNIRGLLNPLSCQTEYYALLRELRFRILQINLYIDIVKKINSMMKSFDETYELNLSILNKELDKLNSYIERFNNSELSLEELKSIFYPTG